MSALQALVTGGAGFIGSHFLRTMLQRHSNWTWHIIDRLNYAASLDRIADLRGRIHLYLHDLRAPFPDHLAKQLGELDYVFHFGAETHVDRSMVDPTPFVETNVLGTFHLLEHCRLREPRLRMFFYISTDESVGPASPGVDHKEDAEHKPSNPYSATKAAAEDLCFAWNHSMGVPVIRTRCWDTETRVMTPDGFKGYDELKVGDQVWTLDANGRLATECVGDKVCMAAPEQMVRIRTAKVDQLVTPNHRMMIRRSVGRPRRWGPVEETRADTLLGMKGRVRIPLTGIWHGKRSGHPVPLVQLAGWYVAEGCRSGWDRGELTLGVAGNPRKLKAVEPLLSLFGRPHKHGRSVSIWNPSLAAAMAQECGEGALNKHIPSWILEADMETLRAFFTAVMAGDGSLIRTNTGYALVYYTSSSRLAMQICEVGMKLGYAVRVSQRETWTPRKDRKTRSYIVRFREDVAEIEARSVSLERYEGTVWCISVPSGRVFVERNGIVSLSGQTMNNIAESQHPEKYVPKIIRALLQQQIITVHGSPDESGSRKYLYAPDHADAIDFLTTHGRRGETYNVVGAEEVSNLDMVRRIEKIMNREARIKFLDFHATRPGHDLRYSLDGGKLAKMGWMPPTSLTHALEQIVAWSVQRPEWLGLPKEQNRAAISKAKASA